MILVNLFGLVSRFGSSLPAFWGRGLAPSCGGCSVLVLDLESRDFFFFLFTLPP